MSDLSLQAKARIARTFFAKQKRTDDTEYWSRTDTAPEWVQELAYAAHQDGSEGGMLPDDYRYEFLVDALDGFANEDPDESEYQPSQDVSIYTHDLTAWVASRNDRLGYCDEAVSELGPPTDEGGAFSTFHLLAAGQIVEREEVANAVRSFLEGYDDMDTACDGTAPGNVQCCLVKGHEGEHAS